MKWLRQTNLDWCDEPALVKQRHMILSFLLKSSFHIGAASIIIPSRDTPEEYEIKDSGQQVSLRSAIHSSAFCFLENTILNSRYSLAA
jgi:hypothetical protein